MGVRGFRRDNPRKGEIIMPSIYRECPVYETGHFILRLVRPEDAPDLLACYSDPQAVAVLNADSCTSDFYYTAIEEMAACISTWLWAYEHEQYVRFAIVAKDRDRAVGTVEIFGGEFGVLRIDLCSSYETEAYLAEIMGLAVDRFYEDFGVEQMVFKAIPAATARVAALSRWGFTPTDEFRPGLYYYARARDEAG